MRKGQQKQKKKQGQKDGSLGEISFRKNGTSGGKLDEQGGSHIFSAAQKSEAYYGEMKLHPGGGGKTCLALIHVCGEGGALCRKNQ